MTAWNINRETVWEWIIALIFLSAGKGVGTGREGMGD